MPCLVVSTLSLSVTPPTLPKAQGVLLNMKKRKPVGMAFHWFLPRPFGSEARKSVLDRDDPMRYTHPPHRSSPMFFDLAPSEENEVLLPSNVGKVRNKGGAHGVRAKRRSVIRCGGIVGIGAPRG